VVLLCMLTNDDPIGSREYDGEMWKSDDKDEERRIELS
jgi:hypothetical protein